MTMDAIADAITPAGYSAAIVGVALSLLVLLIRFRERNLQNKADSDRRDVESAQREIQNAEPAAPSAAPKGRSTFKTFTPDEGVEGGS